MINDGLLFRKPCDDGGGGRLAAGKGYFALCVNSGNNWIFGNCRLPDMDGKLKEV